MRARTEMNKETTARMKRIGTAEIKTVMRMQGTAPASPYRHAFSLYSVFSVAKKLKVYIESEVRTVMGGFYRRKQTGYSVFNFKHSAFAARLALMAVLAMVMVLGAGFSDVTNAATNCTTYGFAQDGYNVTNVISYKSANPGTSTDADSTNAGIDDQDNGTNTNDCDLSTSGTAAKIKIKDKGTQYNWVRIETGVATGKTLSRPFLIRIYGTDEKGDGTCRGKQMFSNFQSIDVYNYAADDDNVVTGTKLSFAPASIITGSGTTPNGCNYEVIEMDITSLYNSSPLSTFNIRIVGEDGGTNNTEVSQLAEIYIQWAELTCSATAPTDLTANAVSSTQIDLQWTADCTNNDTYNIYRDGSQIATGVTCSAGTMTYSDTTVSPGTTYTYTVRGYNNTEACESGDSNQAQATTPTCTDNDPVTAVNVTPASGSQVSGTVTIQAEILGEGNPGTGSATVTVSGSSACDVASAPMTWNSGTSRWEYSWDTSACGNPAENPITISVDYTDPDCGDLTNGTSNNITIDNTGPSYTVTSCSDCHDYPPTDASGQRNTPVGAVIGSHNTHVNQLGLACTDCHIDNSGNLAHRQGLIDMLASIHGGSYSKGTSFSQTNDLTGTNLGTCNTTDCHGSSSDKWGTDLQAYDHCTICHGTKTVGADGSTITTNPEKVAPPVAPSGDANKVGAHQAHLTASDGYTDPVACNECHTVPNQTQLLTHLDGLPAEITFGTLAGTGGLTPGYNSGTMTCNSVYCHGASLNGGADTTPVWNDANYLTGGGGDCGQCHGNPPNNTQNINYNHLNVTAGTCADCHPHAGSGAQHVDGTLQPSPITCDTCHGYPPLLTGANNKHAPGATAVKHDKSNDNGATLMSNHDDCLTCHGTKDDGSGNHAPHANYNPATNHANGNITMNGPSPSTGAGYDETTFGCTKACHANDANHQLSDSALPVEYGDFGGGGSCPACHTPGGPIGVAQLEVYPDEFDPSINTGGVHRIEDDANPGNAKFTVTPHSSVISGGADVFVTNSWMGGVSKDSILTCTDCHDLNSPFDTDPNAHMGTVDRDLTDTVFLLRGVDTSVTSSGQGTDISGNIPTNTDAAADTKTEQVFCLNCHRVDVYGAGDQAVGGIDPKNGPYPTAYALSEIGHYTNKVNGGFAGDRCGDSQFGTAGKGSLQPIGCTNCHAGGAQNNGTHGAGNFGLGDRNGAGSNTGFMNGNAWLAPPDATNGCYAGDKNLGPATSWSNCQQGTHR